VTDESRITLDLFRRDEPLEQGAVRSVFTTLKPDDFAPGIPEDAVITDVVLHLTLPTTR
jgi:hypothetical protein